MDVTAVLFDILVVLLAAKLAAEIADRIRIPAVVGEIVAGILVGPSVLGLVGDGDVLSTLAELGVILLLLEVGMEMNLRELRSVGPAAMGVAVTGVVLPFAAGYAVSLGLGLDGTTALFVGAALTATSVGITARVFGDLRVLASAEARTVLGAAVADDVLGLVILTVVVRVATEGSVSVLEVLTTIGIAVAFLVASIFVGQKVVPPLFAVVSRASRSAGTLVAVAFAFTLALAEIAHTAELAPIIGAFVAGLVLAQAPPARRIRRELAPVGHLFIPVFFLKIGIDADLGQFADGRVLGIAGALLVIGVIGKVLAGAASVGMKGDRFLVGLGMIPRGEVGLIFATIGLREEIFGTDVYASLVLVVLLTTVITPPLLKARISRTRSRDEDLGGDDAIAADAGDLSERLREGERGAVELDSAPGPRAALALAFTAAAACARRPAGSTLMSWFDEFPRGLQRVDERARAAFVDVLERGSARSWRLLLVSGALERSLPELAHALERRGHHGLDLDPLAALDLTRLEAVRRQASPQVADQRDLLLIAAVSLDAAEASERAPVWIARRTADRLGIDGEGQEQLVAFVEGRSELLDAARADVMAEEPLVALADSIGSATRLYALHALARAEVGDDPMVAEQLDRLMARLLDVLAHPELASKDASAVVEARRREAAAFADDPAVQERIETVPRSHLLGHSVTDVVRHAGSCVPVPERDEVRVVVATGALGTYRVEFVTRDRSGLLAREAALLGQLGYDIARASVVTWPDGVALADFVIRPGDPDLPAPDAVDLSSRLRVALRYPPATAAMPDVSVEFDDHAVPWCTRAKVHALDRRGLLAAVAGAFAAAGVAVHSARIETHGALAADTFDVTTPDGGKLAPGAQDVVRRALETGSAPVRVARRGDPRA